MAKQTINIGAAPNDGTGTPLRTSFDYTNQNFTELYTSLGGGTGLPGAVTQVLFNNGTNVAGDAGMTYNSTTDVLSIGGVTATGNVSVAGTFSARNGDNASSIRAAASDYEAVNFDGATSGMRVTSALTGQNIGTGDFSVWSRFRVPASAANGRGLIQLHSASTAGFIGQEFTLYIRSGGTIAARINGATSSDYILSDGGNVITSYAGQVIDVVFTRTGTTVAMYINGTSVALTNTTSGTIPTWADTITSTYCHIGNADGALVTFSGRIYRSVVFNRALSASDVTELIALGVNPADQWGTQTQIVGYNPVVLNGDFETWSVAGVAGVSNGTATNWSIFSSGAGNSVTQNGTSPIAGTFDCLFTMGAVAGLVYVSPSASTAVGKRYRAEISAKRVSGTSNLNLQASGTNTSLKTITLTTGSVVNDSTEYVADSVRPLWTTPTANSVIQLDNAAITRIGAIVDLDFTVGTGYQTYDRSTNNLHGTLFNGVEFMMPRRAAVLYATTNTSGNQQMLATTAIPTNAVIEDIIVNSTGSATVSVGNASTGTQLVNAASVVAGRQKLTLATPFSTTGNLWVNSSAAVTLQFTISYTIAL